MQSQLIVLIAGLGALFLLLTVITVFVSITKKPSKKIIGQALPVMLLSLISTICFFAYQNGLMTAIDWVKYGFIFFTPALLMTLMAMFSMGVLGVVQSKVLQSRGLLLISSINLLALPGVAGLAWRFLG